jgi:hypothetical protein
MPRLSPPTSPQRVKLPPVPLLLRPSYSQKSSPARPIARSSSNFKRGLALIDRLYGFEPRQPTAVPKRPQESEVVGRVVERRNGVVRRPSQVNVTAMSRILHELIVQSRSHTKPQLDEENKADELLTYHAGRIRHLAMSPRRSGHSPKCVLSSQQMKSADRVQDRQLARRHRNI